MKRKTKMFKAYSNLTNEVRHLKDYCSHWRRHHEYKCNGCYFAQELDETRISYCKIARPDGWDIINSPKKEK